MLKKIPRILSKEKNILTVQSNLTISFLPVLFLFLFYFFFLSIIFLESFDFSITISIKEFAFVMCFLSKFLLFRVFLNDLQNVQILKSVAVQYMFRKIWNIISIILANERPLTTLKTCKLNSLTKFVYKTRLQKPLTKTAYKTPSLSIYIIFLFCNYRFFSVQAKTCPHASGLSP